jgi:hypothetical protein
MTNERVFNPELVEPLFDIMFGAEVDVISYQKIGSFAKENIGSTYHASKISTSLANSQRHGWGFKQIAPYVSIGVDRRARQQVQGFLATRFEGLVPLLVTRGTQKRETKAYT